MRDRGSTILPCKKKIEKFNLKSIITKLQNQPKSQQDSIDGGGSSMQKLNFDKKGLFQIINNIHYYVPPSHKSSIGIIFQLSSKVLSNNVFFTKKQTRFYCMQRFLRIFSTSNPSPPFHLLFFPSIKAPLHNSKLSHNIRRNKSN